jgi:hypothetical protein
MGANIMMIVHYQSKKAMKESIGQRLRYTETSLFGAEYRADGTFCGSNRPQITGAGGREFFATITMKDGLIAAIK